MPTRRLTPAWVAASFLLTIILPACSHSAKPDNHADAFAVALVRKALYRPPSRGGPHGKIILPNAKLIGCTSSSCPPVLPRGTDSVAVYPWQVSLDYTDGSVIGLVTLYDEPASVEEVQAAVNESYAVWANANFRTGPVRLWRVEPEHFAIQLSQDDNGMIRLIYLTFDAKHPTSERALKEILDHAAKNENQ